MSLQPLDDRVLPAVTAVFSAAAAQLRIVGDELDNTVVVSRDAAGAIFVNNGAVAILGDPGAIVANTRQIMITGAGGNDILSLNEANGAMPSANIFGGDGADVLAGGAGIDFIDGGTGGDIVFLGAADDTFQWNPGDGSDTVDGQNGFDTMVFNGSDLSERIDLSANGNRVRFTRDVGTVAMDLDGVEVIDFNALGGADAITINDQTATDIFGVRLNLNGAAGAGDGQADSVILNGTDGDDFGQIASFGTIIGANASFFPFVNITGAEGTNDTLTVNALSGNDGVDAGSLAANAIGLTLNGGAGNDMLLAGGGNDLVNGGPGNDTVFLEAGDDTFVWNPGDGSDTVDGQAGNDLLRFNGSDVDESFNISRNGGGVRLFRDAGNITMGLNDFEGIDLNALGGADTITVNDQSGTDLSETGLIKIRVNLNGAAGAGDGRADAVVVNATNEDDNIRVTAFGNIVRVDGLFPFVDIDGAEAANDRLTVNALGGNDVVDASTLPTNLIGLAVNLGDGQAAPQVSSVVVNDGAAQRSRVTALTVTFSAQVAFTTTPAAAFTLTRSSDSAVISFTATTSVVDGRTVVALTNFGGAATQFGSLADGDYKLATLASQVSAGGIALDGNDDGTGGDNNTLGFFRFFGDSNGDRRVDIADFGLFSTTFNLNSNQLGFNAAFDFNNDGRIDIADFGQFSVRFFTALP